MLLPPKMQAPRGNKREGGRRLPRPGCKRVMAAVCAPAFSNISADMLQGGCGLSPRAGGQLPVTPSRKPRGLLHGLAVALRESGGAQFTGLNRCAESVSSVTSGQHLRLSCRTSSRTIAAADSGITIEDRGLIGSGYLLSYACLTSTTAN